MTIEHEPVPIRRYAVGCLLIAVLVVAVILLLLGTGLFPGSGSPGGAFSSGWTLLILLVLLPCMLMPLMMGRHRSGDAERDRKDDGRGP